MKNTTTTYDEVYTQERQKSEELVLALVGMGILALERRKVTVFSLPSASWAWEKKLNKLFWHNRFIFTGVEKDPEIHAQAKAVQGYGRCMYNRPCTAREFFSELGNRCSFDVVCLDWMENWSPSKEDELEALFKAGETLSHGGYLILTVSLIWAHQKSMPGWEASIKKRQSYPTFDTRGASKYVNGTVVKSITRRVVQLAKKHGVNLSTNLASVYYTDSGSMAQANLLFRRG